MSKRLKRTVRNVIAILALPAVILFGWIVLNRLTEQMGIQRGMAPQFYHLLYQAAFVAMGFMVIRGVRKNFTFGLNTAILVAFLTQSVAYKALTLEGFGYSSLSVEAFCVISFMLLGAVTHRLACSLREGLLEA